MKLTRLIELQDHIEAITDELALCKEALKKKEEIIEDLEKENVKLSEENDQLTRIIVFADLRINKLLEAPHATPKH